MSGVVISVIGAASLLAVWAKGWLWAFRWVYLPTLILVPLAIAVDLPGVPELTCRRAVCLGLIIGAVTIGRAGQVVPPWRLFDCLALFPVLSFSISYFFVTDFKGFYHRLPLLALDWGCPYLFARAAFGDVGKIRAALRPIAIGTCVLGCLAVYECRMAARLAVDLWNMVGLEIPVPTHYGSWRWGYLRAWATFLGPITMGTFFVTVGPLMVLWALLDRKRCWIARAAAVICAAGCISSLSRGPILVLAAVAIVFTVAAIPKRALILAAFGTVVAAAPFLVDVAHEEVAYTQRRVDSTGNTADESAHYRVALLLVYGRRIMDVGWFGDPDIVGDEHPQMWSIDNAYLYLFLVGGWIGGGTFLVIILTLLYRAGRRLLVAGGWERKVLAASLASFAGVTACMANIWFSPDYTPFFWIVAALLFNVVQLHLDGRMTPRTVVQMSPVNRSIRYA